MPSAQRVLLLKPVLLKPNKHILACIMNLEFRVCSQASEVKQSASWLPIDGCSQADIPAVGGVGKHTCKRLIYSQRGHCYVWTFHLPSIPIARVFSRIFLVIKALRVANTNPMRSTLISCNPEVCQSAACGL